jgi:hypothetical protein
VTNDLVMVSRPLPASPPLFDMGCYETIPPPLGSIVLIR